MVLDAAKVHFGPGEEVEVLFSFVDDSANGTPTP